MPDGAEMGADKRGGCVTQRAGAALSHWAKVGQVGSLSESISASATPRRSLPPRPWAAASTGCRSALVAPSLPLTGTSEKWRVPGRWPHTHSTNRYQWPFVYSLRLNQSPRYVLIYNNAIPGTAFHIHDNDVLCIEVNYSEERSYHIISRICIVSKQKKNICLGICVGCLTNFFNKEKFRLG